MCGKRKGRKEERKKRLCVECSGVWRKWWGKKRKEGKKEKKKSKGMCVKAKKEGKKRRRKYE